MLKLFPRVILADKTTELRLSGDELINGTKVTVSVQSMEKYNVPHTDKYRIDEDNRLIARDIVVNTDCLLPPKLFRHITRRGSIIWL